MKYYVASLGNFLQSKWDGSSQFIIVSPMADRLGPCGCNSHTTSECQMLIEDYIKSSPFN